jgi:adhesin/invasin
MVVLVKDRDGDPVPGVTVNFAVSTGEGALSSATAESDVNGEAWVSWTLGGELGIQTLRAEATDEDGAQLDNSPLELSAQAVQPQPARIVLLTTLAETAQNGVPFEQQPVIEVLDAEDQPVPQVEVLASVSSGGASLTGATSASSDASGQATFTDLALVGPQGAQTLRFSVTTPALEVTSGPIQLVAGTAATLTGVAPLTYEGTVNSPVSPGPSVVVQDAAGNPVPAVEVTFTPDRNASVSPETATTNEQGVAQVSWTLGTTANVSYSLTARVESSSIDPVGFSAMARPGAAGRLRITVQPSSPTQSGTAFTRQPVIQVVDQNGNPTPTPGLTVTATISSGPAGSLQGASATTDATGRAAFSGLTLTGAVGSYTLSFSSPSLAGVTSSPFAITVGGAARLAFTRLPSTAARSRAPLVIQPIVQIQDPSGNPIRQAGTTITASVTTAQTSLTGETATTDENGRATFSGLTITGIPGPKDLTFSAPGLRSVSARVTLPSVATVSGTPSHPVSLPVATRVPGLVVTWIMRDAATRPVADANFTLTVTSNGTATLLTPLSDANGAVQVADWTLGPTAGYQYLELRLPDSRVFRDSILALPDVADSLQYISGDGQEAPAGSDLPAPLVVRVVDRYRNGVGNVAVQWSTCDGELGPVVATDDNGYSSTIQPTQQPSGDAQFCTMASVSGLKGSPVQFYYTVTASSPSANQLRSTQRTGVRPSGLPPVVPRQRTAKSTP